MNLIGEGLDDGVGRGKHLKRRELRVRNVRHQHTPRRMRDREWNLRCRNRRLGRHAACPKHRQLIRRDLHRIAVVRL